MCYCCLIVYLLLLCSQAVPVLPQSESWTRFFPRARKEFRRRFLVNWTRVATEAQRRTKFQTQDDDLHVHVISLRRLRERGRETLSALTAQGIPWKRYDGVDGLRKIDMNLVKKYAGLKKHRRISATMGFSDGDILSLKRAHDESKYIPMWLRRSLHERLRFGCYMSHVFLWQKIASEKLEFAVVLEDDAVISANFTKEVKSRLDSLPFDWDLLYLNGCFKKFGPLFAAGVVLSRGSLCTFGYVISGSGASKLLEQAVFHGTKPIDHVLDEEILTGRLLAFHAEPPLIQTIPALSSTLAY